MFIGQQHQKKGSLPLDSLTSVIVLSVSLLSGKVNYGVMVA
jgi:hypothetical protein